MRKIITSFGLISFIFCLVYLAFMIGAQIGYERSYDAYNVKAKVDASKVGALLLLYRLDHGSYPEKLNELVGAYAKEIPKDPWGNEFGYITDGSKAIVFSNGSSKRAPRQIFHVE